MMVGLRMLVSFRNTGQGGALRRCLPYAATGVPFDCGQNPTAFATDGPIIATVAALLCGY